MVDAYRTQVKQDNRLCLIRVRKATLSLLEDYINTAASQLTVETGSTHTITLGLARAVSLKHPNADFRAVKPINLQDVCIFFFGIETL